MDLLDFFTCVEASKAIVGIDITDQDVTVQYMEEYITIPLQLIETLSWPLLHEAIVNKGDLQVLRYMTRVVGYYSRTENWNKSKLGELKDRHRGDYTLTEC